MGFWYGEVVVQIGFGFENDSFETGKNNSLTSDHDDMKDGGLQWIKLYFFISISSKERTTTELIAFAEAPMMDKLYVDPCFPSNLQSKE